MLTLLFSVKCQESQTHNFCLQHDSFFLSPLPLVQRLNRVSVFPGLCGRVLASCISCHVVLHFWLSCALPFSAALFKPLGLPVRSPFSPFCLPLLARPSPRPLLLSVVVPPPSGACAAGLASWSPFLWSWPACSSGCPCSPASLRLLLWSQENRAVWGQFSPTTSAPLVLAHPGHVLVPSASSPDDKLLFIPVSCPGGALSQLPSPTSTG